MIVMNVEWRPGSPVPGRVSCLGGWPTVGFPSPGRSNLAELGSGHEILDRSATE